VTGRYGASALSGDRRGLPARARLFEHGLAGIRGSLRELPGDLLRMSHGMGLCLTGERGEMCGRAFLVLVTNEVTEVVPPSRTRRTWDVLVTATKKYDLIRLPEEG